MYWVKPKRPGDADKRLGLKKLFKRLVKHRPRLAARATAGSCVETQARPRTYRKA